jgi:hypothetical protein
MSFKNVNQSSENNKRGTLEDDEAAELIKDSLSFDDDDENSEIARIMNRPASNLVKK